MVDADYWIQRLDLKPHPEGGFYKEVFRSRLEITKTGSDTITQACTSIYYLLRGTDFSGFHRLGSDEIWYYHAGEPILIYSISQQGNLETHELSNTENGSLSVVVEAGCWFSASVKSGGGFSLVSCAVSPAFEFRDFEMAERSALMSLFPVHRLIIEKYCR